MKRVVVKGVLCTLWVLVWVIPFHALILPSLDVEEVWGQAGSCVPGGQTGLQTEFSTDPTARGYTACTNDSCVLNLFNAVCTVAACKVDQTVSREQVWAAIDNVELVQIVKNSVQKGLLDLAMTNATFDLSLALVRTKLTDIFPATGTTDTPVVAPNTRTALNNLRQRNSTRAFQVCGRQGNLYDVSCGLRGQGC